MVYGLNALGGITAQDPKKVATGQLDAESRYGKQLLNLLVDDIRVDGKQATVRDSYASLDLAVDEMKMGAPIGVPRFVNDWCAGRDSNS